VGGGHALGAVSASEGGFRENRGARMKPTEPGLSKCQRR
jgi:hypothetical protein